MMTFYNSKHVSFNNLCVIVLTVYLQNNNNNNVYDYATLRLMENAES